MIGMRAFKIIMLVMWAMFLWPDSVEAKAINSNTEAASDVIDPQVRALILGRNFFKLQHYIRTLSENDRSVTAIIARAQISALVYDFEGASNLLQLAEALLANTDDERLKRHVSFLVYLNYSAQEDYQGYLNRPEDKQISFPTAYKREIQRRNVSGPVAATFEGAPVYLENMTPDGPYIMLGGLINDKAASILFDTGSDQTLMSSGSAEKYRLPATGEAQITGPAAEFRNFGFSQLDTLQLGNVQQVSIPVSVPISKSFDQQVADTGDMIMGFRDIRRFGGVKIFVDEEKIKAVERFTPVLAKLGPQNASMLIYNSKPIVQIDINGDVYSCLIDTGAPSSFVSEAIFRKYKNALGLKSGKKTRSQLLGTEKSEKLKTVKRLPLIVNGASITLRQVGRRRNSDAEYCFLGADAIKAAGGLTFDFINMTAQFGQIN